MATAEEKFRGVTGDTSSRRIQYVVRDAADDNEAITTIEATAPASYSGLPMTNIEIEELSFPLGLFIGTAVYGVEQQETPETSDIEVSFDVSVTTQHVTTSLSTVASYRHDGDPFTEIYGQRIAVDENGENPEGVDVRVPVGSFQVTYYAPVAVMTESYWRSVLRTVGKVNNAEFYGFDAGEVLFVGAAGQQRNADDWQLTFRFEVNENRTDVVIAQGTEWEITVDEVDGWDLLWVKYGRNDATTKIEFVPQQANVERVYERADLSAILGI